MPVRDDPRLRGRVESVLDALRPGFLQDGGNVELLAVEADGTVRIELQGTCVTCPAQTATLHHVVEPALRKAVPGITAVVPMPGDPTPAPAAKS